MKKTLATLVAMAALSGAAFAEDLSFLGKAEYAFEAETFETKLGAQYDVDNWSFVGLLVAEDTSVDSFEFTGVEVIGAYAVNENVDLYAKVETDGDMNYEETTIGTAFRF